MAQGYVLERASMLAALNLRLMVPDNYCLVIYKKSLLQNKSLKFKRKTKTYHLLGNIWLDIVSLYVSALHTNAANAHYVAH
jgi:hypothetical protein